MIIRKHEEDNDVRPGMEKSLEEARMTYFWTWFNVLTMGLVDVAQENSVHHDEDEMRDAELNMKTLKSAETCLETMRDAAYAFVQEDKSGWSLARDHRGQLSEIGLFFHCYPHCSVNSLHLHIVDLSETDLTYEECSYKNLSMELVLKTLKQEIEKLEDEMQLAGRKNAKRSRAATATAEEEACAARLAASKARGATEVDTRRAQAAEAERQARIAMVQAKAAQVLAGTDGSTEAATSRAGRAAAPQGAASAKPRLSFSRLLTVPTETAAAAAEASREVVVRAVAEQLDGGG